MNKIMIIGCSGSGKSTLALKLHHILQLELIQLDQHYWKPNWTETPKGEWKKNVYDLSRKRSWIMDGNYGGTMDIRLKEADTVIYLDYSMITCLYRVIRRTIRYIGRVRPDMSDGCTERFDYKFLHYVATFNSRRRDKVLLKLIALSDTKQVIILRNDKDVDNFVKGLQ